ncbi:FAD-dependent monooxygenase [Gimesia sp.]|uniref:NAD(P)/FAD-dependent oxidoreductase n=1 Tax=Gimesia sp. TaxID=2024833 RepID=UPI000C5DCD82|nr:FAD-dependent monooxygenase [Gimesia sp.]MAX36491.1 hypothetical protein [Gimesia sp.]HAH44699.1 hypothetical protein [Planctomycetaceae bacterium]HBL46902.1 hypothetical protein [Planctomycetaceae bacterium]|tara:strand:- start:5667 stop:6743 length:1077 start_codon:yes stop_codon:yes gene_type:complete
MSSQTPKISDVVILGAGPAGAAAAITLLQHGIRVLIIEATLFPRTRPGETLHPGVEVVFQQLGVAKSVNSAGFIRYDGHTVESSFLATSQFQEFGADEEGPWFGYQAPREQLDSILLEYAVKKGAVLLQPGRPTSVVKKCDRIIGIRTNQSTIHCQYVLDATGRHQWLTKQLGLSWEQCSKKLIARYGYAQQIADFNISLPAHPMMTIDQEGWTWLAPLPKARIAWVRLCFNGRDPGSKWSPPKLNSLPKDGKSRGADVTWRKSRQMTGENWMLLGDAAFVLDPSSSHGVLRAMMSGILAAQKIANSECRGVSFEIGSRDYANWMEQWFDTDIAVLDQLNQSMFGFNVLPNKVGIDSI